MANVLKGEIRHCAIEPVEQVVGHEQGGPRPVLILSRDRFNTTSRTGNRGVEYLCAAASPLPVGRGRLNRLICRGGHGSWPARSERCRWNGLGDLLGRISDEELEKVKAALLRLLT